MSRMPLPTDPRQLVPTPETRCIAQRMIQDAARTSGADAVLRSLPSVEPAQLPALIGAILATTKAHTRPGRPPLPLWFSPEERRESHRLYKQGDRTPRVVAGQREYQRVNQRALRARGGAA